MKIVEMLRLAGLKLSQREISKSAGCAKSTVGDTLIRCRNKGVDYQKATAMTDEELQQLLFPELKATRKAEPEWEYIHDELTKHKTLNLQFLWEEFRANTPDGIGYSQFCEKYGRYRKAKGKSVTMHQERVGGETMQVDWIGDTPECIVDPKTGIKSEAHFFVAVLGSSGYPFVEAFPNEQQIQWMRANVDALEYYGGVPKIIIPDNCPTAVKHPKYCEPVINSAYWEFAQHYKVAILPARVKKPRDKSLVEQSVGWLETWLLGKLRNQYFFSFAELNLAVREYVNELSDKQYEKQEGSRRSVFEEIDRPMLRPLPEQRYEIADVVIKKLGDNYHLEYDGFYYSAPYTLHGEQLIIRATDLSVEIVRAADHQRVAVHRRYYSGNKYISEPAHMPANHRALYEQRKFDGARYRQWARDIGENTFFVINKILTNGPIEEQGYRASMAILQFSKTYGNYRLEASCKKACKLGSYSYTTVKNILKNGTEELDGSDKPTPKHANIRGGAYYR